MTDSTSFSIAGQLDIICRHKLAALCAVAVGVGLTVLAVVALPRFYGSSATLVVQRTAVPSAYIDFSQKTSTTPSKVEDRLERLSRAALSRGNLIQLVERYQLYPADLHSGVAPSLIAEKIAKSVSVVVPGMIMQGAPVMWERTLPPDSFVVTFEYFDPVLARRVSSDIANLFIDENQRQQTQDAEATTKLLDDQVSATLARIKLLDERIRVLKERYRGSLPEDLESNRRAVSSLRAQLQGIDVALVGVDGKGTVSVAGEKLPKSPADELPALKTQLADLRALYSDDYPDVRAVKAQIAALESETSRSALPAAAMTASAQEQRLIPEKSSIESQINDLEAKIARIPAHEQEFSRLVDDRTALTAQYHLLLDSLLAAQMYREVVEKGKGDRLVLLGPVTLPTQPDFPKSSQVCAVGAAITLLFALTLPYVLYFTDTSFKTPGEFHEEYGVSVLATIPEFGEISGSRAGIFGGVSFAILVFVAGACALLAYAHSLI